VQPPRNADRRTEQDDEVLDSLPGTRRQAPQIHQQRRRSTQAAPNTDEDQEIAQRTRQRQQQYIQPRQPRRHPLFYIGLGMLAVLVAAYIISHVGAWYVSTFQDPSAFTQTAHKDTVTVTDTQGHQYQARAFIDPQNHIDLMVLPMSGDTSKARIIQGPAISHIDDPQHRAMITATARGSMVTVLVQGPLVAGQYDLIASRQSEQWTADASQQSKGGK
jgi:hypothetical protein